MKHWMMPVMAVATVAASVALVHAADAPSTTQPADEAMPGQSVDNAKLSYAAGAIVARTLKLSGAEVDTDAFFKGFKDMSTGKCKFGDAELSRLGDIFKEQVDIKGREMARLKELRARQEGDKFLAENAKKEGVKVTADGLQYKVLKQGTGKTPKATDKLVVWYKGSLIDGTVFDTTDRHPDQNTIDMSSVIPGWVEGLQLMKEGARYQFVIPPALGYGSSEAAGGVVPPNSVLIFEVELVKIQ